MRDTDSPNDVPNSPDSADLSPDALTARIRQVKERFGARIMIPAHFYQKAEILELADCTGDSFQLSTIASKNEDAEAIFFCGVHFMAETADILVNTPEKVSARNGKRVDVILPAPDAGCTMADMADEAQIESCWSELSRVIDVDDLTPVTYVNSSAALKAFCGRHGGAACTSSNAQAVLNWAFSKRKRVLFFPDQHLGRNTALDMGIPDREILLWNHSNPMLFKQLRLLNEPIPASCMLPFGGNTPEQLEKCKVVLWNGFCTVHQRFTVEDVIRVRLADPKTRIVVHPECRHAVVAQADMAGSTAFILNQVKASPAGTHWAIGTEWRMIQQLRQAFPDRIIDCLSATPQKCESMDRINPGNLCRAIEAWEAGRPINVVRVADEVARDALKCLEQMLRCK